MASGMHPLPPRFERETGITEPDWLRSLPRACGLHVLRLTAPGQAQVDIGAGRLLLQWQVLPPRRIARITLPRMLVHYAFEAVDPTSQADFMRHFDLAMQRGGG